MRDLGAGPGGETILALEEVRAVTTESLMPLGLTRRQAEILALLAAGKGVQEIAAELFISPQTVRKHIEHVYGRLGVHSRAAAISVALGTAAPLRHHG